jgi:hypothetical protein
MESRPRFGQRAINHWPDGRYGTTEPPSIPARLKFQWEWLQLTRLHTSASTHTPTYLIRIVERLRTGLRAARERIAKHADEHAQCVDRTSAHLVGDEESSKRRQILDGACKVFLDLGFDGASMGEIARAAHCYKD